MTDDKKTPPEDSNMPNLTALLAICCCIIGVWGSSWLLINRYFSGDERGVVGDTFGAVNALFSGLAFSVLIYTMFLQRAELKLQREELRETRAELAGQKEQMEIQSRTMQQQRFEQTFFNLLELFSQSVKSLEIKTGQQKEYTFSGRDCFPHFVSRLRSVSRTIRTPLNQAEIPASSINVVANEIANKFIELSQYTSIFDHVLSFIDKSDLSDLEKQSYAAILQSMLTQDEKTLLYYRGLSTSGIVKLKPYIERYALLSKLSPEWDSNIPLPTNCYEVHAFGDGAPE